MAFPGATQAATYGGGVSADIQMAADFHMLDPIHSEYTPSAGPTRGQQLKQSAMELVFDVIKAVAATGFASGIVALATLTGGMSAPAGAVIGAVAGAAWVLSGVVERVAQMVLGSSYTYAVFNLMLVVRVALVVGAVIGAFVLVGQFMGVSLAISAAIGFAFKALGIGTAAAILYHFIDDVQRTASRSGSYSYGPTLSGRFDEFERSAIARVSGIEPYSRRA